MKLIVSVIFILLTCYQYFISYDKYPCKQINQSIKCSDTIPIIRDSLIGRYDSKPGPGPWPFFLIFKDSSFFFCMQAPSSPCAGYKGMWRIENDSLVVENYPLELPAIRDSLIPNSKIITFEVKGQRYPYYCQGYKSGKYFPVNFDRTGLYHINKASFDSIFFPDYPCEFWVYQKLLTKNYYKIHFFKNKSSQRFYYKFAIKKNYILDGYMNNCYITLYKTSIYPNY